MLGTEEIDTIGPACDALHWWGACVGARFGRDSLLMARRDEIDLVVAMYHDQGLAPLKAMDFGRSVNWASGSRSSTRAWITERPMRLWAPDGPSRTAWWRLFGSHRPLWSGAAERSSPRSACVGVGEWNPSSSGSATLGDVSALEQRDLCGQNVIDNLVARGGPLGFVPNRRLGTPAAAVGPPLGGLIRHSEQHVERFALPTSKAGV